MKTQNNRGKVGAAAFVAILLSGIMTVGAFTPATASAASKQKLERITVNIWKNYSSVELDYNDTTKAFQIKETDKDDIIEKIADKLDMSESKVKDKTDFLIGHDNNGDDDDNDIKVHNKDLQGIEARKWSNYTSVEFDYNNTTKAMRVDSTDKDKVISAIAKHLDMSKDDVKDLLTFKSGRED